ncbi:AAA family ATPase [Anaeroselena agilis]|uniref:AAA family ATPase n=1 Tax=Anaeroselena agilis TaxID=3063788 RepID=A0ABU3NZZ3_9FIRM|nr:AAA family ATPase [Selenomonadales bacterium 4137-cl]
MSDAISLIIGQPLQIKTLTPQATKPYTSRIVAETPHTVTVSIPYDQGRIMLLPVGSRLEITIKQGLRDYVFNSEIISRDLGETKTYTLMRPQAISRTTSRTLKEGMSRVIAVTSGKGGVGKTTFTINLAIALAAQNKRVFIIDADLGTANVDVLLRLSAKYNITHLLAGDKSLLDIAVPAPGNIAVIPGGSGFQALTQMTEAQFGRLIASFNQLDGLADLILLDTGAGISRDVSNFLLAADETIIVTTPEPHAITDAYAIIKVTHSLACQTKQMLVVNRAENRQEAEIAANRLLGTVNRYLGKEIEYIGYIEDDPLVSKSLKQQQPFLLSAPQSVPSRNVSSIAARLLNKPAPASSGMSGFLGKMLSLMKGR